MVGMVGSAVFKEEEMIGAVGMASRRPCEWSAGYILLAAMAGMVTADQKG